MKLHYVLEKDITVMTGDRSREKSVRCQICYCHWPFKNDVCTFLPITTVFLFLFFFFFSSYSFLVSLVFSFFTGDGSLPKWPLLLLLLYYHACFLLYYLVHLPASYLGRRYVSLVWHFPISSVACFPAPARSFSQDLSFVAMCPHRCNSLLRILGLNWNSCKFSGFNTH